jgi:DNA ligase-1
LKEDTLKLFAETLESVSDTSSKKEKTRLLSEYFRILPRELLPSVCRFILGRESVRGDVGVGWSSMYSALNEIFSLDPDRMRQLYLKYGDVGEAVKELFEGRRRAKSLDSGELTLRDLQEAYDSMAQSRGTGSSETKKKRLVGLLLRSTPLEAKYITRILMNELRVGATEGIVLDSLAQAFGIDSVRDWYMVLGDIGELALKLSSGDTSEPMPKPFRPVSFMLALPLATPSEISAHFGKPVLAEYKYDGVRVQAHVFSGQVRLFSRRMEDMSQTMPEVLSDLETLDSDVILDGEVLAFEDGRALPFTKLQQRLHRKRVDEYLQKEVPVHYFAFDILYRNGRSLLNEALTKRREELGMLKLDGKLHVAPFFVVSSPDEIGTLFRKSREEGYEGLVLKDPDSRYTPGRRGGLWVKLKEELDTIDAVVLAAEYGNGKRAGLLSDLTFGVWDNGVLRPIGKAYSGLTDDEIAKMTTLLKEIKTSETWNGVLVPPRVVLEVAFDSIQKSDRHEGGYALRFPRIKRIRDDKRPEDADTLERVEGLYLAQSGGRMRPQK